MYFKKLELLGFKSFADKTTLYFEPGITAVVGPNGCGKSNIFDAIRWVLGEQSVKSLRGSKMEDVIFNGTESIPALGYAEVSLTFANETKVLPIDYDEVTVTRRLFRSGESEYCINKTQVRLKDITELFLGTGIGAESYSLIEQGKIDLILSSKPEDRRLVFDEAAGISKYKSQKRETMRRLEDAEANLLRINDIIIEVKRQINSLERQAAKARRYKDVFEKLKGLETTLAAYQLGEYEAQIAQLNLQLEQLIATEMRDAQAIEGLHKECAERQKELDGLETQLSDFRSRATTAANAIAHDVQELGFNRERIEELKKRIALLAGQREELAIKITQDRQKIDNFKANLDVLIRELEGKNGLEAKASSELENVSLTITTAQATLKEAKTKVIEFAAQEALLHNQVNDFTSQLNQAIARKKRLDIEKLKNEEELSLVNQNLMAAQELEDTSYRAFTSRKEECEQIKTRNNQCLQAKDSLSAQLQNHENELAALSSQKEFLCNLKLQYENITESSNATVLLDVLSDEKVSGIIIKVEEVQKIQEGGSGIVGQAKFKARGVAKPISLDPEEVINKIEALTQQIQTLTDSLARKSQEITELALRLDGAEKSLRESELEYNTCRNKKDNIRQHAQRLKDEFDVVCLETQDIDAQVSKLTIEEKSFNERLVTITELSKANQETIDRCLEEIASGNSAKERILLSLTQLKTEISAYQEKVAGQQEARSLLEEAYVKSNADREAICREESDSKKRIQDLESQIGILEAGIEDFKKERTLFEEEIQKNAAAFSESKQALSSVQDAITQKKDTLDEIKSKVHELQLQLQQVTFLRSGIEERMHQVYKMQAPEVRGHLQEDLNIEEVSQEVELLKQKIESYGQVNLVAIEEFDELKQRYDFLINQQSDLLKSKESLHEAILKINRTTKKIFLETFEKLVVEFKNYFRLLFGGGDAQLFLVDEQDVLESGIEIVCRPPGKKLQNVLLLSGGEKSMSASALMFAIFKVKPSPFCVLDEIDAALDEANVDRFSRMLVDFTAQSQFIVITHNKKTIANANIMYGITMEKAGISKIVSVKLAENTEKKKLVSSLQEEQKVPEAV